MFLLLMTLLMLPDCCLNMVITRDWLEKDTSSPLPTEMGAFQKAEWLHLTPARYLDSTVRSYAAMAHLVNTKANGSTRIILSLLGGLWIW